MHKVSTDPACASLPPSLPPPEPLLEASRRGAAGGRDARGGMDARPARALRAGRAKGRGEAPRGPCSGKAPRRDAAGREWGETGSLRCAMAAHPHRPLQKCKQQRRRQEEQQQQRRQQRQQQQVAAPRAAGPGPGHCRPPGPHGGQGRRRESSLTPSFLLRIFT